MTGSRQYGVADLLYQSSRASRAVDTHANNRKLYKNLVKSERKKSAHILINPVQKYRVSKLSKGTFGIKANRCWVGVPDGCSYLFDDKPVSNSIGRGKTVAEMVEGSAIMAGFLNIRTLLVGDSADYAYCDTPAEHETINVQCKPADIKE